MFQKVVFSGGWCSLLLLCLSITGQAQVIAGIRANGKVMNQGDTIRVCAGSTVIYQSIAQGAWTIEWTFPHGSPTTAQGNNPPAITYNTVGYDTAWQHARAGNVADSLFIIVQVSNIKPSAGFTFGPNNVCGNIPISFTNTSTGDQLTYRWTFSPVSSTTEKDPAHPFLEAIGPPGTQSFPVKLVTTNYYGCRDSVSQFVTVKRVPDAAAGNADPLVNFGTFNNIPTFKFCSNIPSYTFSFTNTSTTLIHNAGYVIKWGDGKPDSAFTSWPAGTVIKHTFPRGSSTMTIEVTSTDGCIGIKKYTVFVGSNPAGGLASLGNTDVCSGDSLRFTINGTSTNPPGTLYSFLINDGSFEQTFLHPAPGVVGHYFDRGSCGSVSNNGISSFTNAFGAYLTITNPCGTTSPSVVPIYVSGKPRAILSGLGPVECINASTRVYSSSQYGNVVNQTGGTSSTCVNTGKQVWTISPATGYTISGGSLGSLNGSPTNGLLWTSGTNGFDIKFLAAGNYTIKLYVTNDRCGIDSTEQVVCVRAAPQASFSAGADTLCVGSILRPSNTSPTGGGCFGDAYTWNVNSRDPLGCSPAPGNAFAYVNGTDRNSFAPELQLNKPGQYIMGLNILPLRANNTCLSTAVPDTVYVRGVPKVVLAGITSTCINNAIRASATVTGCYSSGPFAYEWSFANGTPATSTDAVPANITFATPGTYAVQLKVTDLSCNLSTTVNTTVIITGSPVANAGTDQNICSGESVAIGMTAVPGITYTWSPAIGLSNATSSNPFVALDYNGPANDTTYGFKLTASAGSNCQQEDSIYITVRRRPDMAVLPASGQLCAGQTIQLTVTGAGNYNWTPAATIDNPTADVVTASPTATTTYAVSGSLPNGCSDTVRVPIQVNPDAQAQFTASRTRLCTPVNLDTVIQVSTAPGNGTYTWYVNGTAIGSNTTGVLPSYPVNAGGQTLVVKLVVQSAAGCKPDSLEMTFQTATNVTADFTKSRADGCAPLQVAFTNTSNLLAGVQFFWDFGNGVKSNQPQPGTISFPASPVYNDTTYYIVLKAFNGCDTTVHLDSVKVFAGAKARFGADATEGCSPFRARLRNTSPGTHTAYYWDFGDGEADTTRTTGYLDHVYHTGQISTYTVRLIAENQCGRDTQNIALLVSPNSIQAQLAVNGNQLAGCAPHTARFINNSVGAAQLHWNFGDGSAAIVTPNDQNEVTHVFTQPGQYTITIRLNNNCTDTTITRQVTVYAVPDAAFTVNNTPACANYEVTTTNASQNAQAYQWVWGDGQNTSSLHGSHRYAAPGIYSVKLLARSLNNFGVTCTDSLTQQITIVDRIPPQIIAGTDRPCVPYTLRVRAGGAATAQSIRWTFYDPQVSPGVFYGSGEMAAYVYNKPGRYQVKLVVQTAIGCLDSTTYDFEVLPTPRAVVAPVNPVTCNTDTTIHFQSGVTYDGTDAIRYKWLVNGVEEGLSNPFAYRFTVPRTNEDRSTFHVQVVSENSVGCGDTASAGTVTIQPLLKPAIIVTPGVVQEQPNYTFGFRDSIGGHPNKIYDWDMGDATRQHRSGREISYRFGDTGTYQVSLSAVDYSTGCQAGDSVKVTILYLPGYLQVPNAFCPGCSTGALRQFLPMGKALTKYRLRIFNGWGQVVFESTTLDANGSPNQPWDGRVNGQPVQQDSYQWQIEAQFRNGTEWKGMLYPGSNKPVKAGFVTIIR